MKLDINEVYHKYIIKIVIFALFTFKGSLRQPLVYKQSVYSFVRKRLPWVINLEIDTGERFSKCQERNIIIDEILSGIESNYMTKIKITFTTPLKKVTMNIDLKDEDKYSSFIYS